MIREWVAIRIGRAKAHWWQFARSIRFLWFCKEYTLLVWHMVEFLEGDCAEADRFFKYWHETARSVIRRDRGEEWLRNQ